MLDYDNLERTVMMIMMMRTHYKFYTLKIFLKSLKFFTTSMNNSLKKTAVTTTKKMSCWFNTQESSGL